MELQCKVTKSPFMQIVSRGQSAFTDISMRWKGVAGILSNMSAPLRLRKHFMTFNSASNERTGIAVVESNRLC
jgi:hypothetical protein